MTKPGSKRLIMSHPSLLPIDEIEPAFGGLVPVCMELPVPSGYLDNLLVTPSGNIALIECKLWRNPEARREVVGQIIDYANDMSKWTYQDLEEAIKRTKSHDAEHPTKACSLYERVTDSAPGQKNELDELSFVDAVSRNLKRGRFLLLIAGDGIREGVESLTHFLQQHAGLHFTLGLVELALFAGPTGGYIVQPRVLARTTNIVRGIVTFEKDQVKIAPPREESRTLQNLGRPTTITRELFLERLDSTFPGMSARIDSFVDKLSKLDVVGGFRYEFANTPMA